MTINIALATSEGLVFGCDSIASSVEYVVDPFELESVEDEKGELIKNPAGHKLVALDPSRIRPVVTNAWPGVTKLFQLHQDSASVAAVTAGIARLNNRTMKSYSEEFFGLQQQRKKPFVNVQAISNAFLRFMRKQFTEHYKDSQLPEQYWDGPHFLVGGYGARDELPSVFRLDVRANTVTEQFPKGSFGIAWDGQADSIERLIRGYDSNLKNLIENQLRQIVDEYYQEMTNSMAKILGDVLARLNAELPLEVDTVLPSKLEVSLPWDDLKVEFSYGNLPLQSAVDFVAYMVNLQSGMSRFAPGVATVGGRTHIAIVTKGEGFRVLNEPEVQHRHTGFGDDV